MGKGTHAGVHVNITFFVSSLSASSRSDSTAAAVREPALWAGPDAPNDRSRSFHTRCDVLQLCTFTFRRLPLCYRPQMQSVPSWLAVEEGALLLLFGEALGESQMERERRVLLAAQQQPGGLGRPSRDGNSCQEVYRRMQQQDTQNTDSFSGFSPMCDEEVPQFHLPMGGVDRHPAGGSLGVDGWVWPPAQHAVSTDKFFPALLIYCKIMINPRHWNLWFCSCVCYKGWWSNGTPTTLTVLTWGGRKVCLPSAVTLTGRGFARKSSNTYAALGHSSIDETVRFHAFI